MRAQQHTLASLNADFVSACRSLMELCFLPGALEVAVDRSIRTPASWWCGQPEGIVRRCCTRRKNTSCHGFQANRR